MRNQYTCPKCEKRRGKMKGVCWEFRIHHNEPTCKSEHTPTYTADEMRKMYNKSNPKPIKPKELKFQDTFEVLKESKQDKKNTNKENLF